MKRLWRPYENKKGGASDDEVMQNLERGAEMYPSSINEHPPEPWPSKPQTASECDAIVFEGEDESGAKVRIGMGEPGYPCPFVSCVHHLAIDVYAGGAYSINAETIDDEGDPVPSIVLREDVHTCERKAAQTDGGMPLEMIGEALNVSRERVRQIVDGALDRIRLADGRVGLRVLHDMFDASPRVTPKMGDVWRGDDELVIVDRLDSAGVVYASSGKRKRMSLSRFQRTHTFVRRGMAQEIGAMDRGRKKKSSTAA